MTATVLSVIALAVAVVSAAFAGLAAVSTRRLAVIEQGRRFDEQRPRFTGKIIRVPRPGQFELSVTLVSDEPMARVGLTISDKDVRFRDRAGILHGQEIVEDVRPRQARNLPVVITGPVRGPVRVEARSTRRRGYRDEGWGPVTIEAEIEPDITKTVW